MDRPTVSVVMPTNRRSKYLVEAIASVRAQSFPATEIILVDDGSPEPGLNGIAGELGVTYIRQPARGISAARNAGIAAAQSEWIAFLDDDDVWHPERLSAQLAALEARRDAIASYTGGWYMDAEGRRFGEGWRAPHTTSMAMIRGEVPFPRITTVLVRRATAIATGGFRTDYEPTEDNEWMLRLLALGEFAAVDQPLVGYRRHAANLTNKGFEGRRRSLQMVRLHRDLASRRHDVALASALTANLARSRSRAAEDCLDDLRAALTTGDLVAATRVGLWSLGTMPRETVAALTARIRRRLGPLDGGAR